MLLLPPHTPDNLFHLHNDLLVKVAWLLRMNSLAPNRTTLLLFRSSADGRAHLFRLLELILKQATHSRVTFDWADRPMLNRWMRSSTKCDFA